MSESVAFSIGTAFAMHHSGLVHQQTSQQDMFWQGRDG